MKTNRRAKSFRRFLDRLTGINYDKDMLDLKISPKKFDEIKEQYEAALRARQHDILFLYYKRKKTQQEIADIYHVDISAINRIIKKAEREE